MPTRTTTTPIGTRTTSGKCRQTSTTERTQRTQRSRKRRELKEGRKEGNHERKDRRKKDYLNVLTWRRVLGMVDKVDSSKFRRVLRSLSGSARATGRSSCTAVSTRARRLGTRAHCFTLTTARPTLVSSAHIFPSHSQGCCTSCCTPKKQFEDVFFQIVDGRPATRPEREGDGGSVVLLLALLADSELSIAPTPSSPTGLDCMIVRMYVALCRSLARLVCVRLV